MHWDDWPAYHTAVTTVSPNPGDPLWSGVYGLQTTDYRRYTGPGLQTDLRLYRGLQTITNRAEIMIPNTL